MPPPAATLLSLRPVVRLQLRNRRPPPNRSATLWPTRNASWPSKLVLLQTLSRPPILAQRAHRPQRLHSIPPIRRFALTTAPTHFRLALRACRRRVHLRR